MEYIDTPGGLTVSAQGFGAMGMSAYYGAADPEESVATLRRAVDLGITLIDTAEIYGPFRNEELVGRALRGRRAEIVLATKFGRRISDTGRIGELDGTPEYARTAVERSLRHLGTEVIDLLYLHRVDPEVPVEETVGGMAALVEAGLVRAIGLCEVGPETIRRAVRVHPIAAVQSEASLFSQDVLHNGTKDLLDQLGIPLVAYSPLGRGLLAGRLQTLDDLAPDDARRTLPRFAEGAVDENLALAAEVREVARSSGRTAAQVSLAWLQRQGVVPLPGTRNRHRLEENVGALGVALTAAVVRRLEAAASRVVGARDTTAGLAFTTN